ncbi:gametocyte-specific factor 1 homolog [Teleopsis dalmanni]|uniref:gametocyte-specific factor 1 homolog n=1 Tax=Teleopsis dalmanni TaxID=139649 RepID=UPI0018CFD6F3|nr:gametocyte-specific factor 1 homolog [Teleopsis dalmanni]XP_037937508.1 gametocyte-specific factor 1 homolog [Teleopsis dalmanni]XP_037937509.1 gametocyte-specific factor 1 homolog [Teleopsis dalmanni]
MASKTYEINENLEKIVKDCPLIPDMLYVQCPYDRTHLILRKRFQTHLLRCSANYKNMSKVKCPFNVTHIINKPELEWHLQTCKDRRKYEEMKHSTSQKFNTIAPQFIPIDTETSWDDEPVVKAYNPQNYIMKAPIYRYLQGATPTLKNEFRIKEIKRMRTLKAELGLSEPIKTSFTTSDSQ